MSSIKEKIKKIILKIVPHSKVYMFHKVLDTKSNDSVYDVTVTFFEEFIRKKKHIGSLNECLKHPHKNIMAITFDDGTEDVFFNVYSYLKKINIPFTVFIVSDFIDKPGFLSLAQLKELSQNPLVTIGCHGKSHSNLTTLNLNKKEIEIVKSKEILESMIDKKINYYAYSHGQYDENCVKLVSNNYEYAFKAHFDSINVFKRERFCYPRYIIKSN